MRKGHWLWAGLALVLILVVGHTWAAAVQNESLAYSDDFDLSIQPDDGLGNRWRVTGRWYSTGSMAVSDSDGKDVATQLTVQCADCRVESKVIGFGVPEVGVVVRQAPNGDRYDAALQADGGVAVRRWRNGEATVLGRAPSGISDPGDWSTLSLRALGSSPVNLVAMVNGAARLRIIDSSIIRISGAGSTGLFTTSAGVVFSNYRVFVSSSGTSRSAGSGGPDAGVADAGDATDAGSGAIDSGTALDPGSELDAGSAGDGWTAPDAGNCASADAIGPATSAGGSGVATLLFRDDFTQQIPPDEGLGTDWTVSGAWYEKGGALADLDAPDLAQEVPVTCADCRVEAKVLGFGVPEIGVSLRASINGDRYDAILLGNGSLRIRRVRGGAMTTLGEVPGGAGPLDQWITVSLQAVGGNPVQLVAAVNGADRLSVTDGSTNAITSAGRAGLWTTRQGVMFQAFKLWSAGAPPPPPPTNDNDWPFYRRDLMGTGAAPGSLTTTQARGLKVAFHLALRTRVDANPIVAGGKVYLAVSDGTLLALDANTGATLWTAGIGTAPKSACVPFSSGPVGAPAVVGQRVMASGGDGRIYAFDKESGAQLWVTRIADTSADEFLWSSIFPLNGKVYVGVGTLYEPICGAMPGRVVSVDQTTGAVTGTWWAQENHGNGGGVWTQPAYDPATGRLFLTTGPVADRVDPTTEPCQQAFVAIDPNTMATLDSYQPVPTLYSGESDFGASPALLDTADGKHLIVAANKNGYVYALDRDHLANGVMWMSLLSGPGASPENGESTIVSAAVANGTLFVGGGATTDGYPGAIAALDPSTGSKKWVIHPEGFVLPALTAVGDVVIAGVSNKTDLTGELVVVSQKDGTVLFSLHTPARLFGEPTYANGMIYVADEAGNFYALKQ